MLFALLPLATWADTGDISQAQILVQDFEFGAFAKTGDVPVGDKPAVSVYFTTQQGVIAVPNEYLTIGDILKASNDEVVLTGNYGNAELAALPVGNYKIKVTGHTNYSGTVYGNFKVEKATLTISSTAAFISKDFGTANPTFYDGVGETATGNVITAKNHTADVVLPDNFKKLITYTLTETAANANKDGNFLPADPERTVGYALQFAGLTNSDADQDALEELIDDADELAAAKAALTEFANNYNVSYPAVTMKIKQVPIVSPFVSSGNGFYVDVTETSRDVNDKIVYTYTGDTQTPVPTMTIKYKNGADYKTNKYNLTLNAQYDVVYAYSADNTVYDDLDAEETPLKAGYYKVYVKGKTNTAALNTNFYTAANVEVEAAAFQIKKADLQLLINPKNEQYTGVTYTTASITPSGLVTKDQGKIKKADIKFNVRTWNAAVEPATYGDAVELGNTNFVKNVGRYKVEFKTTADAMQIQTGVDGENNPVYGNLNVNYEITLTPNEWYITPKQGLVITAGSVNNHVYNTEIVAQTVTVTGAVNDEEKAAMEDVWEGKVSNTASKTTYGLQADAFVPTIKDPLPTGYTDGDVAQLMANYAPIGAETTETHLVNGTLEVIGNTFTIYPIIPNDDNIVYDGQEHPATQLFATANNQMLVQDVDFEAADENGIQILYKKANTTDAFSADFVPTDAGTYLMKVANVKGKGSFATVTNPVCTEIQFEIAPKELTFTIADVSLWSGATLAHLNAKVEYNKAAIEEAIVENDDVDINFLLTEPGVGAKYAVDDEGVITFQGDYEALYIVEAELTGEDADNYEVKYTTNKGKLTQTNVIDDMPLALLFGNKDAENIADAADICTATPTTTYSVTIGDKDSNKKMLAKQWYAMVLPFDVTPLEIAKALDTYVVVNKIKSSSMSAAKVVTVSFELEMDNIKAGTPFIIKPATEVNWYKKTSNEDLTNSIKFTGKKIYSGIADITDSEDAGYNAATTEFASLSGTYESGKSLKWGYDLDGNPEDGWDLVPENATLKYRWLCDTSYGKKDEKGNLVNQWLNCKNNAHPLKPMEAYMVLDQEAVKVHVLVEDFENGTTTIKSLSADNIQDLKVAEGWYTINGMKLNAAPTEKGIYINNGKKVVVK